MSSRHAPIRWALATTLILALCGCESEPVSPADGGRATDDQGVVTDVPDGALCPASQPAPGSPCSDTSLVCTYGQECCCGRCHPRTGCGCTLRGVWACDDLELCRTVCESPKDAG